MKAIASLVDSYICRRCELSCVTCIGRMVVVSTRFMRKLCSAYRLVKVIYKGLSHVIAQEFRLCSVILLKRRPRRAASSV